MVLCCIVSYRIVSYCIVQEAHRASAHEMKFGGQPAELSKEEMRGARWDDVYVYIYIYIYREREGCIYIYIYIFICVYNTHVFIYIYIYIYIHTLKLIGSFIVIIIYVCSIRRAQMGPALVVRGGFGLILRIAVS